MSMANRSEGTSQILTFLYTDIEGSTRLWEQYPGAVEAAVSRHDRILRGAVEEHGGTVFRTVGDGICAVFANASHAVAAALGAQLALQEEPWGEIDELRVRIALHTGEVEAYGQDFSGRSLNRIGRLLGLTYGGQTLISHATQLLVRDALPVGVNLMDLGVIRMRDLSHPEHLFQLVHPDLPLNFPPLATLDIRPNNLPTQPTSLIGREAELAEITSRLDSDEVRMLTLTGPGGTGKTRLGLQAAADLIDRFEHGVFFVDLASVRDPEAVFPAIARTLGVRETSYRPVLDELIGQLQDKQLLLLLDNFEQITSAAPLVGELLQGCPRLKMLVTSREALRLRVEKIFPVPPLNLPSAGLKKPSIEQITQYEAVRLFIERARAVKPDFSVTNENAPAVAEICARLDGLPLAIELAASRIRLFSPQALLDRLGSRLQMLKGGARDLPTRQQTLRDTIGWSYELLDEGGQRLFELLSVFPGGCTFESAESVAGRIDPLRESGVDTIDGVASLVDKSLIRQVEQGNEEPRFVMLETIREFAAERLVENPDFYAGARRAHATYFAGFTKGQLERLSGDTLESGLAEIEGEIENVHAAWRYWVSEKDIEKLGDFIDGLWLLYDTRGWYHATINLTTDLLDVLSSIPSTPELARQEIVLQITLASALLITKGYVSTEVEHAYTRALHLIEDQGVTRELFPVLRGLSRYYGYRGEFEKAIWAGEQILSLAEKLDDADMRVAGHLVLGTNLTIYRDLRLGLSHLEKGIAAYIPDRRSSSRFRFGTDPGVACTMTSSINLWMLGFPDTALQRANGALDLAKDLKHPFSIAYAWFHTGLLYLWTRQTGHAAEYALELMDHADQYDFEIWRAVASCLQGATLVRLGQVDEGLGKIHWGMDTYQGLKTPPIFWSTLQFNLVEAYLDAGKAQDGLALLNELINAADKGSEGIFLVEFLRLRGDLLVAVSMQNAAEAEGWFGQALKIAQEQNANFLALRAANSLCRVWQKQGKFEESRQLLGEVYPRMTEGISLPDLEEARRILGGDK
jgi:predicted ATPase/class 3 adenylate cyclase